MLENWWNMIHRKKKQAEGKYIMLTAYSAQWGQKRALANIDDLGSKGKAILMNLF